jgi:DNA-binding NtrC family response regulator
VATLAQHFLDRYRRELKRELRGIRADALACLRRYSWPGNVRELENVIERAVVLTESREITPEDLPAELREGPVGDDVARDSTRGYHAAVEEFKRGLILSTLRRTAGNRTMAARLLGLQRTYLARLIRDLGVVERRLPAGAAPVAPALVAR